MERLISGLVAGLLICVGSWPLDAQVVDPRRGEGWTQLRTVNLGPKAGNGIWGNNIVVEEGRNRAFVGNLGSVSVVDLQLGVVTNVIEGFGEKNVLIPSVSLGLSESRDELYVKTIYPIKITIIDLKTLAVKEEVKLSGNSDERWGVPSVFLEYPRPMIVDEEEGRLFVGNYLSISVLDLDTDRTVKDIPLTGPEKDICGWSQFFSLVMDMALDKDANRLYIADMANSSVRVLDLNDFQLLDPIPIDQDPVQLIRDPSQDFLYILARNKPEDPCRYFELPAYMGFGAKLVKYNLVTRTIEGEIPIDVIVDEWGWDENAADDPNAIIGEDGFALFKTNQNATPKMALDPVRRKLWISSSPIWHPRGAAFISLALLNGMYHDRPLRPSKLFLVDLDQFQLEKEWGYPGIIQTMQVDTPNKEMLVLDVFQQILRLDLEEAAIKEERIEIGADPSQMAVSVDKNRIYILRGGVGGFWVLDGEGNVLRTVQGNPGKEIVVDDVVDRLYVLETAHLEEWASIEREEQPIFHPWRVQVEVQLGVYELSTLRRLYTMPHAHGFGSVFAPIFPSFAPDYGRGVFHFMYDENRKFKIDLLTGESVDTPDPSGKTLPTPPSSPFIINASLDRAYLFDGEKILKTYDLEKEELVDTFDMKTSTAIDEGFHYIAVKMDKEGNKFYIWGESFDEDVQGTKQQIVVVDADRNEIVEAFDVGIFHVFTYVFANEAIFDLERKKVYTKEGRIVDLVTRDVSKSFLGRLDLFGESGISSDYLPSTLGFNPLTNTLYSLDKQEGLLISLGPSGTETPPPTAPVEMAAGAGDEEVTLSWEAVDDTTLVGYHVYRQDRSEADFVRITHDLLGETAYRDQDVTNEQTYTYRTTSMGRFALESVVPSDTASATPKGGRNFRVRLLRQSANVVRGDSVSLPISIESLEGFDAEVALTAEAPEGISVTFLPAKVTPTWIAAAQVKAAADAPTGRFEIVLKGEGGGKENSVSLVVEVTAQALDESVLTLELDQEDVPLDIPLQVSGRLFPRKATSIELAFTAERADTVINQTVETDRFGAYRGAFQAPFTDKWSVTASWAGDDSFGATQSRAVSFAVTSGKTRITATSDLDDDGELGWVATIKGRIYPNPGTVGVTLNVRKPDGAEETIEGILSSSEGYYGHDLRMDQQGLWELWTSWKGNDRLLGAASPVVTVPVGADVGRVVMVACGQDSPRDLFWSTSNYLGNLAYTMFQKRRLLKEKVFYLNDRQEQDVDRDGFQEDVDGGATMAGMGEAWTWVKERVNADNPLYVYLVGKGTSAGLEVSEGEVLTAAQLGADLAEIETATGAKVTLIVDAAHAGNFVRDLSSQGRHVIASTGLGLAFYQAEGYLSFSQYFLTDLYQGKSVQEAFLHTHNILRNLPGGFSDQRPGLEAEGNVIANQPGDYLQTTDAFIGAPFELGDLSPQIKASSLASVAGGVGKRVVTQTVPISEDGLGPRLKLARPVAEQGVEISARIDDAEGNLKVVRAMIIPPESNSLTSLTSYPEVELTDEDGDGMWGGVSHEFLEEGVYPVIIYAIDGAGNAAEPLRTTVLVEPPPPLPTGDFNGDGLVDFADFFMFADQFGGTDPAYDLDQSGTVDFGDFFLFADAFGGPLGKLLELAEEMLVLPTEYALRAPYPNPFNSEVVVKYSLPREGEVELAVFNALGQVVRRLVEGRQGMGHHRVVWDGRDERGRGLATGTYIVQLRAGERRSDASRPADFRFRQVQKVALIK